jgi:predicted Zn-dependent protease
VQPNNPYFYELKGQALLEGGHPSEAIAPLRHAVQLSHNNALVEILLAQALNATAIETFREAVAMSLRNCARAEARMPIRSRRGLRPQR